MSAAAGGRENHDREDAEGEDVVPGPGPSKKKRLVSYNKKWEEKHSWVKPVSGDQSRVFCTFCRGEFSISHGGENDLKQHASTDMHKRATKNKGASNIATFYANASAEQDRVAIRGANCGSRPTSGPASYVRAPSSEVKVCNLFFIYAQYLLYVCNLFIWMYVKSFSFGHLCSL